MEQVSGIKNTVGSSTHKLGLKLWFSNMFYINPAIDMFHNKVFDYIELYIEPETGKGCLKQWANIEIPFFLHAPHSYGGLNLSLSENESKNRALIQGVDCCRRKLNPKMVIFHPGISGSVLEMIRQIKMFKNEFPDLFDSAVIENKPKLGLNGETCIGASPEEMKEILNETGLGFCFDIGHAICYAAWNQSEHEVVIDQFMTLNPKIFHLSDGDVHSKTDAHLNLGKGNYELERIVSKLPSDAYISIETNKKSESNLDDFEEDVGYLRKCLQKN